MVAPALLVVCGPTGSGKSGLALRLAEALGGEIVVADSAQVYRGMDVGTAKASPETRARVPHHGIDLVAPDEAMNAARWVAAADAAIAAIARRGRLPIVEGGTFLYLRALLEGLFDAPPPDPAIRARHRERAACEGTAVLHAELLRVDPVAAARIDPADLVRISRALEILEQTGRPISELRRSALRGPRYPATRVVLAPPRDELYARTDARAAALFPALIEEVARLRAAGYGTALPSQQALGYREAELVRSGRLASAEGVARLQAATRRYAKRQLTWVRSLCSQAGVRVYTRADDVPADLGPPSPGASE